MKKMIALLIILALIAGAGTAAFAETGFETLYALYCDEQVFGPVWNIYDLAEGDSEKICLAIFLFDPENDMTNVILIGANAGEEESKYYQWVSGYEAGASTMTFLISQFAELKEKCEEGVDFCISFSFDGGETMTDIATAEAAEALTATLQQDAADLEETAAP